MADFIPIISQAKSLVQVIRGDKVGARKTQDNFTKTFLVISQVRGFTELVLGNKEAAKDTFKAGASFIDGVPVVGHVIGVVHYVCGDKESGDAAMIAASRNTGVIAGSVGGFVLGGPVGAAAGGVYGGAVMDSVTTLSDSLINGEHRMHGTFCALEKVCENPTDPWGYLDVAVVPAMDAIAGYKVGRSLARRGSVATVQERASRVKQVARKPKEVGNIVMKVCETKRTAKQDIKDAVEKFVGHVIGDVHYVCGDKESGDAAMIAASRNTGVIAGSVGGFVLGGPVGAAAGGVYGGAVMDSVTTLSDSLINGEHRMHGTFCALEKVCENPTDPWGYLDVAVVPAMDAIAGYKVGRSLARRGSVATVQERASRVKQVARKPKEVGNIVMKVCETKRTAKQDIKDAVEKFVSDAWDDYANMDAVDQCN